MIHEWLYPSLLSGSGGLAILALRVFVGTAFLRHGYGKVADIAGFSSEFQIPRILAAFTAYTQVVAGALLIIGLATPVAGLAIAGTMIVATLKLMARGEPFINPHGHSYEAPLFYVVSSLAIVLLGPGTVSLDAWWISLLMRP